MSNIKLIVLVSALLLFTSPVSADNWFNSTLGEQFDDAEEGLNSLLIALVAIYIIGCFVLTLYGWKAHNRTVFKEGIIGFGVLIVAIILMIFARDFFDYYFTKYM